MSAKHIRKTFGGRKYAVAPMNPMQALVFAPKVGFAVAGALNVVDLKGLLALIKGKSEEGGLDTVEIGQMVLSALTEIKPEKLTELMKEAFSEDVRTEGGIDLSDEGQFNNWFSEHPGDMLQVGLWCIWEHSKHYFLQEGAALSDKMSESLSQFLTDGNETTSSTES